MDLSSDSPTFSWPRLRDSLKQALWTFPHFLRNPIDGIRHLPDWDWPTLIALQACFGATSGFLTGLAGRHFIAAAVSIFITPIVANVLNIVVSGFFYYTFMFYFRTQIDIKSIFTHLLFASVPVLLASLLTPFVPLVELVGIAAAAILLMVGFSDNFRLPKRQVRNLIVGMYALYALLLIVQLITWHGGKENLRQRATPESLDILEKELKEENN